MNEMKIVILTNNDVYGGILIYPLLKEYAKSVQAIFIQDGIIDSKRSPFRLFLHIMKKSGAIFSTFLAIELVGYKIAVYIRRLFHINNYKGDCVFEIPSHLGKQMNIPVYRFNGSINDSYNLEKLRKFSPDLILTMRYGEILKKPSLSISTKGVINFHPSILPSYAGLGSIFQAIRNNEEKIGYTIHFMDESVDTGQIIIQKSISYNPTDSMSRTCLRIYFKGSYEILNVIQKMEKGEAFDIIIGNKEKSYFSWPDKKEVRQFLKAGKKLIKFTDFIFILFCYPHRL